MMLVLGLVFSGVVWGGVALIKHIVPFKYQLEATYIMLPILFVLALVITCLIAQAFGGLVPNNHHQRGLHYTHTSFSNRLSRQTLEAFYFYV